jgi:hypothetical protein
MRERGRFRKPWATSFHGRLKRLGFRTYDAYLASPHWTDFKTRYRLSSLPQSCLVCSSPSVTLHHLSYERLGDERLEDVVPLCWPHHEAVHAFLADKGLGLLSTPYAVSHLKEQRKQQEEQRAAKEEERRQRAQSEGRSPKQSFVVGEEISTIRVFSSRFCSVCHSVDQITPVQLPLPIYRCSDTGRRYLCWRCASAYLTLLEEGRISLSSLSTREEMWQSLLAGVLAVRKRDG